MKTRLGAVLLSLFALNATLVGVIAFLAIRHLYGADALVRRSATDKLAQLGVDLSADFRSLPLSEWEGAARARGKGYGEIIVLRDVESLRSLQATGKAPPAILGKVPFTGLPIHWVRPPPDLDLAPPPGDDPFPPPNRGRPPEAPETTEKEDTKVIFALEPDRAGQFWSLLRLSTRSPQFRHVPTSLALVRSDNACTTLFPDTRPLYLALFSAVLASLFIWLPFAFRLTHDIRQMEEATERMATGDFTRRVSERRNDELGALARSINRLGCRITAYVQGQRRFIGDIAHELGSPLARLRIALEVGRSEDFPAEERAVHLAKAQEEADELAELIQEMLSLTRAELSPDKVRPEVIALEPLVRRIATRELADLPVQMEIPPNLSVLADSRLLSRVLSNILRNIPVHAGPGVAVRIRAEMLHWHELELVIEDSGPGVAPTEFDQLFAPFYRADHARSSAGKHVGLGLAIVKDSMEAMNGRAMASPSPLGGLALRLTLRAVAAEPDQPNSPFRGGLELASPPLQGQTPAS